MCSDFPCRPSFCCHKACRGTHHSQVQHLKRLQYSPDRNRLKRLQYSPDLKRLQYSPDRKCDQYETTACTASSNRQCTFCPPNATCPAFSNNVTANTVCQNCTTCRSNEFERQACTSTTNTQCLLCLPCSDDQYQQSPCNTTTNTICAACTTCGVNQYASPVCSDNSNAVCNECASCDSGKFIRVACSTVTDTECEACRQCPPGETPTPDSRCKGTQNTECQVCAEGKYKSGYGNQACDDCESFETSPTGSTTETDCRPNAQFESMNACQFLSGSCQCKAGHYGYVPFCTTCAAGKYKPSVGPQECLNCQSGKYSTTEGATSETVCQWCSSVANTDSSSTSSNSASCACSRGYVWNTVSSTCVPCETGTFMPEGESECQVCKRWV